MTHIFLPTHLTLAESRPWLKELVHLNLLEELIEPLNLVTLDLFVERFIDRPLSLMMSELESLDLDVLRGLWGAAQDTWSAPAGGLEGELARRMIEMLGAVNEVDRIEFGTVFFVNLLTQAFKSLKEDGGIAGYLRDPIELPEPPPELLVWRIKQDRQDQLECEIDGTLIDIDVTDTEDASDINDVAWFTIQYSANWGFRLDLEREVYLDRDRTQKARRRIAHSEIREFNIPENQNTVDLPLLRESGKLQSERDYYQQALELWLMGWELASERINLIKGIRKGAFTNRIFIRENPDDRYRTDGPGPYPHNPNVQYASGPDDKTQWQQDGRHQYKDVYAGRTPEGLTGTLVQGQQVRV